MRTIPVHHAPGVPMSIFLREPPRRRVVIPRPKIVRLSLSVPVLTVVPERVRVRVVRVLLNAESVVAVVLDDRALVVRVGVRRLYRTAQLVLEARDHVGEVLLLLYAYVTVVPPPNPLMTLRQLVPLTGAFFSVCHLWHKSCVIPFYIHEVTQHFQEYLYK